MARKTTRRASPAKKKSSTVVKKKPAAKGVAAKKLSPVKKGKKKAAPKPLSDKSLQKPIHAQPSPNPAKQIRERIRQHPNAMVTEIVASLEMDGVSVTSDQVQQVMNQKRAGIK